MKPHRQLRVGAQIKRELAQVLRDPQNYMSEHNAEEFFFTVTEVRLTKDLQYADVWVSVLGFQEHRRKALESLRSAAGRLRYQLSQRLNLRHTPELRFDIDETLDHVERIESILKEEGILNDGQQAEKHDEE